MMKLLFHQLVGRQGIFANRIGKFVVWGGVLLASLSLQAQDAAEKLPEWIWSKEKAGGEDVCYFRKTFDVPVEATRVLLVIAADNKFDASINGEKGGRLRGEDWERPTVEDITDRVRKGGKNLLAIQARNGGGSAGLLGMIEIKLVDDSVQKILSDNTWLVSEKGGKGWNEEGLAEDKRGFAPPVVLAKAGGEPWTKLTPAKITELANLEIPEATPVERIRLPEGFQVELLYSVPKVQQGSWVAMTIDDSNRLIVSDQYGALYRMPIPKPGKTIPHEKVEKIPLDIGGAQGLLYAFDSLYVVLNTADHGGRGLYRLRDTNGDDQFDEKKLLAKFEEIGGEHGPHAVVKGAEPNSIYVITGDQTPAHLVKPQPEETDTDGKKGKKEKAPTEVIEFQTSRVPRVWDEDLLLERPIGRGFMKGVMAPGGWIAKTDPDGKNWELIATGFRNEYDAAINRNGDLFTYDADMEWDMNTPWYRPTRINFVASGAEFGWRNGGGKWPAYYPDSLPAVVDIGPGSPTGVTFGYGAKFPARYQDAFYACDWSYGKLYAIHLAPDGASYKGEIEEFMSAQPLPLTDLLVNPADGAMYITIGGRRVQSGLYRVTYQGQESTAPSKESTELTQEAKDRRMLETLHHQEKGAVEKAWPFLSSKDRYVRFAARIAIEHQPVAEWQDKALAETNSVASIQAMIALARNGDKSLQEKILASLGRISWDKLSNSQRVDLVRAYSLAFTRMGEGTPAVRKEVGAHIMAHFPAQTPELNAEMTQLLCYLQVPGTAEKGIALLKEAPSQEEQMGLVKSLRHLKVGWTQDLRKDLFSWFVRAQGYRGGASFGLFVENMKQTALDNTPEADKEVLKPIIEEKLDAGTPTFTFEPRNFQKAWNVADFDDVIHVGLEGNRDFANGRKMFGAATCFACHRFNQEGGAIGPDLTSVSGKFSPHDLLESVIEPSKEISDQYGQMVFTMIDGSQITGRVMNLSGDNIQVNVNMMNPNDTVGVDRKRLKEMNASTVSMMPPGLLNTLTKDDVLDLLAYLLSKGNPEDPMFAK